VFLATIFAGLALTGGRAVAHDETVSSSDVVVEGGTVVWRVDVGVAGLAKVVHLPEAVTESFLHSRRPLNHQRLAY